MSVALALERQHHALGRHVGGHQLEDLGIDVEARQIDRRHAVLTGEDLGDVELGHQTQLDDHVAEALLGGLLLRKCLGELLAREQPVAQESFAEPVAAARRCGRHESCEVRSWGF